MKRVSSKVLLLCVLAVLVMSSAHSFSFILPSGTQQCFSEEVPSNTEIHVSYSAEKSYGLFIDAVLLNSESEEMWNEKGKAVGRLSMMITDGGMYSLCFTSRSSTTKSDKKRAVSLSFQMGSENKDYAEIATKDNLKPMEIQLRVMEDIVQQMHTDFIYFKDSEAEMRDTNETMTARVLWISIGLIFLFVFFFVLQLRHLKMYFKKKRMID